MSHIFALPAVSESLKEGVPLKGLGGSAVAVGGTAVAVGGTVAVVVGPVALVAVPEVELLAEELHAASRSAHSSAERRTAGGGARSRRWLRGGWDDMRAPPG
jgi:hypothetical protein